MTAVALDPLDPSGGVVAAAPLSQAGLLRGMAVSRWETGEPEELSASSFDTRVVCLQLRPINVTIWSNGRRVTDGVVDRGSFQAHAPGDTFRAFARRGYDLLRFVLPEAVLADALEQIGMDGRAGALELVDASTSADPFLLAVGLEITRALAGKELIWRLHADRLAAGFVTQLLARHSNLLGSAALTREISRGALAPWQLKRAIDHVLSHLADDFSLADLAGSTRLSPFHFARAFKRSTGLSPHRFVMERRVERARQLLGSTAFGLAEIALACGFASQSHFTTAFRRHMGVTPGAWRAEVRR